MGKKLYVGNLTYAVTHSNLEEWFSQYGTVQSAQVITDRDTGRSKGFGFVEMDTDAQAEAAIQGLNEQEHDGRRLTVNEAKPRVARTTGGGLAAVAAATAVAVGDIDCSASSSGFEGSLAVPRSVRPNPLTTGRSAIFKGA